MLAPIAWGTTYVTVTELLPDDRPLLVATMRVIPAGIVLLTSAPSFRAGGRGTGVGDDRAAGRVQLRPVLPTAQRRRVQVARRRRRGRRRAATAPGRAAVTVARRAAPRRAGAGDRLHRRRRSRARRNPPGAGLDTVGLLAAVGANVSFAIGVVLTKRYPTPSNRIAATGWQLLIGGAILLPLMLALEGAPPALTGRNMAGFMYLSLVGTAVAFIVWFNGIRRLPAAFAPAVGLGGSGHRCGARMGRPRPVAVSATARRIRHHDRCDRVRRVARSRSAALLDVGPLVAAGQRCDGTAAAFSDRGRSSRAARTAPPSPSGVSASAGSTLQSVSSSRESGLRSSNGSPVASPGTSAENSRSYSATVASTAWSADTQCIVDFTLRPSGALPPDVAGS